MQKTFFSELSALDYAFVNSRHVRNNRIPSKL